MVMRVSAITGALLAAAVLAPSIPASKAADASVVPVAGAEETARPARVVMFEDLDQVRALAAGGPTVVFFNASWCPSCQATMRELNGRWEEARPGLALVIADYDKETGLKRRLGVTYQDTFVQVDEAAERVGIWNGGGLAGLNANVVAR